MRFSLCTIFLLIAISPSYGQLATTDRGTRTPLQKDLERFGGKWRGESRCKNGSRSTIDMEITGPADQTDNNAVRLFNSLRGLAGLPTGETWYPMAGRYHIYDAKGRGNDFGSTFTWSPSKKNMEVVFRLRLENGVAHRIQPMVSYFTHPNKSTLMLRSGPCIITLKKQR